MRTIRTKGAGRPEDARKRNLRLVLNEILTATTPPSRAEVATKTGITRATVSRLCDELIATNLVLEQEKTTSSTPGRPATPLVVNSRRFLGIGVEINVSSARLVAMDIAGDEVFSYVDNRAHRLQDPRKTLSHLGTVLDQKCTEYNIDNKQIAGATISIPGLVDRTTQQVLRTPNLSWDHVYPSELFKATSLNEPATVTNEANAAALASTYRSPGILSDLNSFLYISGEIGVGGAIIIDHDMALGNHGWAGEVGHLSVNSNGPQCQCGSQGCLEQYLGLRSISRNCGFDKLATNRELINAFRQGDVAVRDGLEKAAVALGVALVSIINIIDVHNVVLGGYLAELTEVLTPTANKILAQHLMSYAWDPVKIYADKRGPTAASIGGAIMAVNRVFEQPADFL